MPNTPALIGAGITGLCALPEVSAAEREAADRVLRAVGSTVWIADEAGMDAVTAISGSGPAYVFLFIEALEQAAAELGFTPEQGRQLAVGTVQGAAALAAQSSGTCLAAAREGHLEGRHHRSRAGRHERTEASRKGSSPGSSRPEARGRELGRLLGAN
jgi:pyrroline-5-carboxylate reductase